MTELELAHVDLCIAAKSLAEASLDTSSDSPFREALENVWRLRNAVKFIERKKATNPVATDGG